MRKCVHGFGKNGAV